MNPINTINIMNNVLQDILNEKGINMDSKEVFKIYCKDFCSILKRYYPSSTIMIKKDFRLCALLIDGRVYNSFGEDILYLYRIADYNDINYINYTFKSMSKDTMSKFNKKIRIKTN